MMTIEDASREQAQHLPLGQYFILVADGEHQLYRKAKNKTFERIYEGKNGLFGITIRELPDGQFLGPLTIPEADGGYGPRRVVTITRAFEENDDLPEGA
jgi:hypothetical protein